MKKYLLIIVFGLLICQVTAQNTDSSALDLKDTTIREMSTRIYEGEEIDLKKLGLNGEINSDYAFRYKDRIYVVGTSEKYSQFYLLFYLETESHFTNVFVLEYDTNGRYIDKHDFKIANNRKEYTIDHVQINHSENIIYVLYSIRNVLSNKNIYMLSSMDLESKETNRIKIAETRGKSKDRIELMSDIEGNGVVLNYLLFDKEEKKYSNESSIRVDKNLNVTENNTGHEKFGDLVAKYTSKKNSATYMVAEDGNNYTFIVYTSSVPKKYKLAIKPASDEIVMTDFDENKSELFLVLNSSGSDFKGFRVDRISMKNDSITETLIPYVRMSFFDSLSIFSSIRNRGFQNLAGKTEKEMNKIKNYYYYQTGIFDHSTGTIVQFHSLHYEYQVTTNEETKHYIRDRNGNERYSHSTWRQIKRDRYRNGPVIVTFTTAEGAVQYKILNLINDFYGNIEVDLRPVLTGPGKVHLSSAKAMYYLDLKNKSIVEFNPTSSISRWYGRSNVIPMGKDFAILEQSRSKFKLSLIKSVH